MRPKCKTPHCLSYAITEAEDFCRACMRKMKVPEEDITMLENLQISWDELDEEYKKRRDFPVTNLSGTGSIFA